MLGCDKWFPVQAEPQNPRFPGPTQPTDSEAGRGAWESTFSGRPPGDFVMLCTWSAEVFGNHATQGSSRWASEWLLSLCSMMVSTDSQGITSLAEYLGSVVHGKFRGFFVSFFSTSLIEMQFT